MKKILLFISLFLLLILKVNASNTFYLGDHVPDIYIYMNRINKQVYRQFRLIYKSGTNELVYCIEPGETLSSDEYDSYSEFNNIFNLSEEKFNRIKLIAYYGYNYKNHTDIKWYAITQYIIWKEIMPDNWELYFVDSNHNKIDNQFNNEINEIYRLVDNHNEKAGIYGGYFLNYVKNTTINGTNELVNYETNKGIIDNNKIVLENLNYGQNNISLTFKNYKNPLFYYNNNGQNILLRGDVFKENINFYVYVYAGKVKVNECNEETFNNDFLGGTYEVLNSDDALIGEIKCIGKDCIGDYLPVGYFKIRVKNLPSNYEKNDHIYDVEIKDKEISEINICSIPKKESKKQDPIKNDQEESNEIPDETPYELDNIEVDESEDYEVVSIPYTSKYSHIKYLFLITLILSFIKYKTYHENN